MADDLVKRLRSNVETLKAGPYLSLKAQRQDFQEAADRIEQLEARLTITDAMVERAVKALWPRDWVWMQEHASRHVWLDVVRAALEAALQTKENDND